MTMMLNQVGFLQGTGVHVLVQLTRQLSLRCSHTVRSKIILTAAAV